MPARARMSDCAPSMISSNGLDRWLISITDIPTPGSATRSRCASSSTGSGSTDGPAEKLKTRCVGMPLIYRVRRLTRIEIDTDDAHRFGRNGFLRLIGRGADVMRAVHRRLVDDGVGERSDGL